MLTQEYYNWRVAETARFEGVDQFTARCIAARDGYFSVDTIEHRMRRAAEHDIETRLNLAYAELGMDRQREHKRIAAEMEAHLTGGIWATSTAEYARRRQAMDDWVLDTAADGERFSHDIDEGLRA